MLDQMMVLAADQSSKAYQLLDGVSQNLGNTQTWGYKSVRFEQYIRPNGQVDIAKRVDYQPAPTFLTRRELDVALNGPGFIQVTRPNGETAYTRNGSLAKNPQGFLITQNGDMVGTGIQIPTNYEKLGIKPDGTVEVILKKGEQPKELGKITVVNFPNPEGLKSIGNNLVMASTDSGNAEKIEGHHLVQQGRLEQSNVNIHYAVEDVLRLNAGVIANLRVIKAVDEIYREAVQLRQ